MKIINIVLCLLILIGHDVHADTVLKEIRYGQSCLSPDKRFSATFAGVITIQDRNGGKNFGQIQILTPIYCLAWARNSITLFIVEHIAGGSELSVLQFADGKWSRHEIDPPPNGDFDTYKIVGLKIGFNSALVSYITGNRGDNGGDSLLQQITFDLNLNDLSISHVKNKKITPDQYGELNDKY